MTSFFTSFVSIVIVVIGFVDVSVIVFANLKLKRDILEKRQPQLTQNLGSK